MAEFGGNPFYSCRNCLNPLAFQDDLLSKAFKAVSGDAYMFQYAMNVVLGRREEKKLMTGVYTIANIYCGKCGQELGWHYLRAHDPKQKYKEGNFILEKLKMIKEQY
ncbi:hypothetical protein LWI29_026648 [Acer saccharum]|uniref:Protein yippee-like n=1 Tax=Acer saccharum TaxID=4024 RepID=A0AA39SNG8_ACESA|nr:hypothetical protein LWI29_026648 [Acer saccharum]KAK1571241.1 hypothetical protein Q3G72_013890 [Acer saccharum]